MPTTLAVLVTAVVTGLVVLALSRSRRGPHPEDPAARSERWLVTWLLDHPRLGRFARHADRRIAGGLMLVVAFLVVFAAAIVLGALFDMIHGRSGIARFDRAVANWGSEHATDRSTSLLSTLTNLGGSGYLLIGMSALAVLYWIRRRRAGSALFLLAVLAGVVTINNTLKSLVDRERPDVVHLVNASGSSFPSGHSAAATACWLAIALVVSRGWRRRPRGVAFAIASLIALSVASSRALLGVHWLTDVIGGVVLGWAWFMICAVVFGGRMLRLGDPTAVIADAAPGAAHESAVSA